MTLKIVLSEEKIADLDRIMEDNIKSTRATFDFVTGQIHSDAEKYRNYRTSAITAAGTIIVPIILTLLTLNVFAPDLVHIVYEIVVGIAVVTSVASLIFTSKSIRLESGSSGLAKHFSSMDFMLKYTINGFRSVSLLYPEDPAKKQKMINSYYGFFTILQSAILYKLLQLAENRLGDAEKSIYKSQIKFMAHANAWKVLESNTVKDLLEGNECLSQLLDEYKKYCSKLTSSPALRAKPVINEEHSVG